MKEKWVDILGYEGLYRVSDLGRVMSLRRKRETIFNRSPDGTGYLRVSLTKEGKTHSKAIHRLVLSSFLYDSPKQQVNHINGIKTDNSLKNLEWVSGKENVAHAIKTGLMDYRGEKSSSAKLRESDVFEIKRLRQTGLKYHQIAARYNVSRSTINDIFLGRKWKYLNKEKGATAP